MEDPKLNIGSVFAKRGTPSVHLQAQVEEEDTTIAEIDLWQLHIASELHKKYPNNPSGEILYLARLQKCRVMFVAVIMIQLTADATSWRGQPCPNTFKT